MNITVYIKAIILLAALYSSTASLAGAHNEFSAAIVSSDCLSALSADALSGTDSDHNEFFLESVSDFRVAPRVFNKSKLAPNTFPLSQLGCRYSIRAPPHHS